jgi:hypothetical protein
MPPSRRAVGANTTSLVWFLPNRFSRKAHGVDLALFTDFEHDGQVEQTLAAMDHQTIAHLAWRFRKWYENKRLLAAIAAPPLREIADRLVPTTHLNQGEKRPFVVYSCHDVVSHRDGLPPSSNQFLTALNAFTHFVYTDNPRFTIWDRR